MRCIFMRHAQAEDFAATGDHDRRLTARGREQAAAAGELLQPLGITHAYVSTAARTRETFELLGLDCAVEYLPDLYNTHQDGVLEALLTAETTPSGAALVVGHNPSMHSWAAELARLSDVPSAAAIAASFPTAALAAFNLPNTTWESFLAGDLSQDVQLESVHLR